MKVAIIDILGLSYDGNTLTKKGLGGSESAVIHIAKELVKIGYDVEVFNNCISEDSEPGIYQGVKYSSIKNIKDHDCFFDIAIASRSVIPFYPDEKHHKNEYKGIFDNLRKHSKHKILWMHDTFCEGDELIEFLLNTNQIHEIFTLSDWHSSYVTTCQHGPKRDFAVLKNRMWQTRNGINVIPEKWIDPLSKDPNLFVYNASATKGMKPLFDYIWPEIKKKIPQARLEIIGGYYQFQNGHVDDQQKSVEEMMKTNCQSLDIHFTGVITHSEISKILEKASFFIYPSAFPETYGISTLEALAHNVPIITCQRAALEEVAIDIASYKINYPIEKDWATPWLNEEEQRKAFIDMTVFAYNNKYLHEQKKNACNQIKDICTWDTVALQWNQHFHKIMGEYLPIEEYKKVQKINYKVNEVFGRRFVNEESRIYPSNAEEKEILVVIPVYNSENYIEKCLSSVFSQDYSNYKVIIINDVSTDSTEKYINSTIKKYNTENKVIKINNTIKKGALHNQWDALREYDYDIAILLDGDDWLENNPNIFKEYNDLFEEYDFIYGSCWSEADSIPLIAQEYPKHIRENKEYREYKFAWNMPYTHLRAFKKELVNKIDEKKLINSSGSFYKAGGDGALFYALLEETQPDKVYANPKIVYRYNDLNPLNDYKINSQEQTESANEIIGQKMKNKKILCAIPTARYIEPDTFKSIFDLEIPEGFELDFQYFYGYRVDQVRNLIAKWTIDKYDYLFSVDHDITFAPNTLKELISCDKDIVTGLYRMRTLDQHLEIYDHNMVRIPTNIVPDETFEIGGCGFGCVLVKKEVFEIVGYPQFEYHPALDHANTFSEDNDFCKKARNKGIKIYCNPNVVCGHLGQISFNIDLSSKKNLFVDPTLQRYEDLRKMKLIPQDHVDKLIKLRNTKHFHPQVIYDLGSCVLHWYDLAKEIWPDSKIIPIEAMPNIEEYYLNCGISEFSSGLVISNEDGKEIEFWCNNYDPGGNSIYKENPKFSPKANELFPEGSQIKLNTITLDTLVKERGWPKPDFIKMDIQGGELDAIKGAENLLKTTTFLLLELQHEDYNIGAPHAAEVIEYLREKDWKLIDSFGGSPSGVDKDYLFFNTRI